jgi:hypothetical protein
MQELIEWLLKNSIKKTKGTNKVVSFRKPAYSRKAVALAA